MIPGGSVSEDSSKGLLVRAMRAGVREVLPLPLNPAELAQLRCQAGDNVRTLTLNTRKTSHG